MEIQCRVVLLFMVALIGISCGHPVADDGDIQLRREERSARVLQSHPSNFADICGKQSVRTREGRVFNGNCTEYGELPWMAQMQVKYTQNYEHHCGGTIITDELILTAAHCIDNAPGKMTSWRFVVGQHNLDQEDTKEQVLHVEEVFTHPNWNSQDEPATYSNDIALVRLRSRITFSEYIAPACLPSAGDVFEAGRKCLVSGWGKAQDDQINRSCLEAATIPIIPEEPCKQMYPAVRNKERIGKGMTCAGGTESVDACKGDSGGPLACSLDGRFSVFGVVSWGDGCGDNGHPGVYTNVQRYLDWIDGAILNWAEKARGAA